MTDPSRESARLPDHDLEPDRRQPYRLGRRNDRNIYRVDRTSTSHIDDQHIGCMFSPGMGVLVVHALNTMYGTEAHA